MTSDEKQTDTTNLSEGSVSVAAETGSNGNVATPPFQGTEWANVRDGFVLVFMGNLGGIICGILYRAALHSNISLSGILWVGSFLSGTVVIGGKWLCRSVPVESGLRELATAFCAFFTYAWLCSAAAAIARWSHFQHAYLTLLRVSGGLIEIVGVICFLAFLNAVAKLSRDQELQNRVQRVLLLSAGMVLAWLVFIFMTFEQIAHHARRGHGGIVAVAGIIGIGFLFSWMWQYLMLIKSLADAIETSRDAADAHGD